MLLPSVVVFGAPLAGLRAGDLEMFVDDLEDFSSVDTATGPNTIAALDRKQVNLFSDLLLHDMGTLGDGIGHASAAPSEMRTSPLWGLRARGPFLHDGRATTVDVAIRLHDGEGAIARTRYIQLPLAQQAQLLQFLLAI